jgi:peptide deformylase
MRALVTIPDPILRQPCKQVQTVDSYICDLISEMLRFLASINVAVLRSYGVAAPQFGESIQVFVVSTPAIQLVAINPVVTKTAGVHNWIEGCLSLPGLFYAVRRPKLIKFQYLDQNGEMRSGRFHDDYAGVVQHEIQHLSGVMIDSIGMPVSRKAIFQD